MRITGGQKVRRNVKAPSGWFTRPTSDFVREAVFNVLMNHFFGAEIGNPIAYSHVLDAFCGSGILSFEALSRGAFSAVMFDKDRKAVRTAQENAASLDYQNQCKISCLDATKPPPTKEPCRLIFLDPPYRKNLIPPTLVALDKAGWIAPNALIVAEMSKKETLTLPEKYRTLLSRVYGDTTVLFITNS